MENLKNTYGIPDVTDVVLATVTKKQEAIYEKNTSVQIKSLGENDRKKRKQMNMDIFSRMLHNCN